MILPSLLVFLFGLLLSAGAIVGAAVIAHAPRTAYRILSMLLRGVGRLRKDTLPGLSARRFMDAGAPLSSSKAAKMNLAAHLRII